MNPSEGALAITRGRMGTDAYRSLYISIATPLYLIRHYGRCNNAQCVDPIDN